VNKQHNKTSKTRGKVGMLRSSSIFSCGSDGERAVN